MVTRWHYYIDVVIIARWLYCLDAVMIGVKLQTTLDCKKKTSTSPNRRERPLIRKTGWVSQKERRDRETGGQKQREMGGRVQCFMKQEEKSLIDIENVETTGERSCHLSWRTPLNTSLCTFIGTKHISPTFVYIIPEADNIYKNPPPNVIFPKKNYIMFRSGAPPMTLLTVGALTDPHLPTTASNVCTTDVRLGGVGRVPPQTKILATPMLRASEHLLFVSWICVSLIPDWSVRGLLLIT